MTSSTSPIAASESLNASGWRLEHTYAQLPAAFHAPATPTPVRAPRLVIFNRSLAHSLGLDPDGMAEQDRAAIFAGNGLPPGAAPIAQAYAGHQFGSFTMLGDGRAILLGEQITPAGGRFDIQLKGPGPTRFSRRGDGRAALGPMLREYIISEAMYALGVSTTRSLAVAATGEAVLRTRELPGAVLTRVASSHIRVGTFEYAAARGEVADLRALLDYTLRRHYPYRAEAENPALALLEGVVERQAALIAQWQLIGFIHGVMNTDNMALSGEAIDYGPCAFMDTYDPATVFSSIDYAGRYAYRNQPKIAQWNLARLAESLLPVMHADPEKAVPMATAAVVAFDARFQHHWLAGMRRKLGLVTEEPEDPALIDALLSWMQNAKADYTNTFAQLAHPTRAGDAMRADVEFARWHEQWQARLVRQPSEMRAESERLLSASNPAVIPRNHLVEAALSAAEENDLAPLRQLLEVLGAPFDHGRHPSEFQSPPPEGAACYQTFCGT